MSFGDGFGRTRGSKTGVEGGVGGAECGLDLRDTRAAYRRGWALGEPPAKSMYRRCRMGNFPRAENRAARGRRAERGREGAGWGARRARRSIKISIAGEPDEHRAPRAHQAGQRRGGRPHQRGGQNSKARPPTAAPTTTTRRLLTTRRQGGGREARRHPDVQHGLARYANSKRSLRDRHSLRSWRSLRERPSLHPDDKAHDEKLADPEEKHQQQPPPDQTKTHQSARIQARLPACSSPLLRARSPAGVTKKAIQIQIQNVGAGLKVIR